MAGNVVVDDVASDPAPPRRSPTWIGVLAAAVVVGVALVPGGGPGTPPTTVGLPEVVTAEDRWRRLELPAEGVLADVTVLGDGSYLAVGTGPQVWLSADRETWTWDLSDPLDWGHMADASDTPHGPVAVGFVRPADGINRAAVWFRDEGAWRQVLEAPHEPSELVGVAAGGGQVLAWGWRGTDRPHAATGDSILYGSDDGAEWSELRVPEEMRVLTAAYVGSEWLIGGYAVGKPAVWRSADLEDWEEIPTDEMTYGWVVEHIDPGRRAITVVDLTGDSTPTRWVLRDGQTWERVTDVPDPRPLGLVGDETGGAKDGQLWVEDAGEWRPLEIEGWVEAVSGGVAVGHARGSWQPTIWVLDAASPEAQVPAADGPRWREVVDLGAGRVLGAWQVAGRWLVGTESGWWLFDGEVVLAVDPPWDEPPLGIRQVEDEWVAYPGMHWTSDGVTWERRGDPIPDGGVQAVAHVGGRTVAVGVDPNYVLWTVAESTDHGRTWEQTEEPAPTTPLWGMVATADGFVATAARARGAEQVVASSDGSTWEPLTHGQVMLDFSFVPAVWTTDGALLLLDRNERVRPPRGDVEMVARDGARLVAKAGGRAWVGGERGGWEPVPMGATVGIDGPSVLVPLDGMLFALVDGPDAVRIVEWAD